MNRAPTPLILLTSAIALSCGLGGDETAVVDAAINEGWHGHRYTGRLVLP